MRLHQLNLKFEPEQDRLLLRINTSTQLEFRLWLTRRLIIGVLPLMRKLVSVQTDKLEAFEAASGNGVTVQDPKIREFLSEIKKDTILKTSDFATPYKERSPDATNDLGADNTLLISQMALTPLANGHMKIKFTGKAIGLSQMRNVQIDLDERLMHGFLHLLEKAFTTSEWGAAVVGKNDLDASSDGAADRERPQYLN